MDSNPRRTQFSSCDACRKARVGCDASQMGHQLGNKEWEGSCSRCSMRNQNCTFEWLTSSNTKAQRFRRNSKALTPFITADSFVAWEQQSSQSLDIPGRRPSPLETERQMVDNQISIDRMENVHIDQWCDQIFRQGFGTIFRRLIGNHGCPLVDNAKDEIENLDSIFYDLDELLGGQSTSRDPSRRDVEGQSRGEKQKYQAIESLHLSIRSFAVRWLPALIESSFTKDSHARWAEIIRSYWRATRRNMLKAINQISYQSVFALYLFGQTPIPVGISEEEQLDGLSGAVCLDTALKNIQRLRARLRGRLLDSSTEDSSTHSLQPDTRHPTLTPKYIDLENRVYWAAMAWDTEVSVTLNLKSSLGTGLRGACREPAWILARGFLLESFRPNLDEWRREEFEISDQVAEQIISATVVCRLYVWRTIASLKEALIEGLDEDSVQFAMTAFLDGLGIFKHTIRPALSNCQRWLQFLGQETRLSWYEAVLHYYLGVLAISDAVEAAGRPDLLERFSDARTEAERESFNVLKFGLENQYILYCFQREQHSPLDLESPMNTMMKASFIALDPYPHYAVASVRLLYKSIDRRRRQGSISNTTYMHLYSALNNTLEQLPQSAITVASAREDLQQAKLYHK